MVDLIKLNGELFENEEEATKLLSKVPTMIKGIELVLGRDIDSSEIVKDEALKELFDFSLTGEDRYALLLLKKATESEQNKKTSN